MVNIALSFEYSQVILWRLMEVFRGTMKVPVGLKYNGGGGTSEKYSGRLTSDT